MVADSARRLQAGSGSAPGRVDLPTLLLAVFVYGGWLTLTFAARSWSLWIVAPAVVVVLILHSSMQHEVLHGHPTRSRFINDLIGNVPLSLWLPYRRYRISHLTHHRDERLTDPVDDPESYYWTAKALAGKSGLSRLMLRAQQTLAGRIVIGSFWIPGMYIASEWQRIRRDEPGLRAIWLEHLFLCIPIVLWLSLVCHIPLWVYIVAMAIPANGLLLIRSFAEHRAVDNVRERVAVVENSWIFGPLFLFNNLHALHHEAPGISWYLLPALYRQHRQRLIHENGGLLYNTYFDVARRFLWRSHDVLIHPKGRAPIPPAAQAGSG